MRIPTRRGEKTPKVKSEDDPYLTRDAIKRLQKELDDLVKHKRREAAEEVFRLAQMGDLSENAGYQAARAHLRRLNTRILSLEDRLRRAIPIKKQKGDRVALGSVVSVEHDGKQETFVLVGAQETNPSRGRISHLSPLGARLVGKCPGDEVRFKSCEREMVYKIVQVS